MTESAHPGRPHVYRRTVFPASTRENAAVFWVVGLLRSGGAAQQRLTQPGLRGHVWEF
jgi:hypothetical protein